MPSTTWSNTFLCANSREPAAHTWPVLKKMPRAAPAPPCSRSASGKTMTGDLPPSSSVTRFRLPAAAFRISLPTSVEPVNDDLVHVRMLGERRARGLAEAGHDVDHAVREARLPAISSPEPQRRERRLLGRLEHDRAAGRERRRHLPRRHHQREVPRHDLADDADRLAQRVGVPVAGHARDRWSRR